MIRKFLFPKPSEETLFSLFLLALRLLLGTLLMLHGVDKLIDYALLSDNFPDPIGMGSQISLILVIFAATLSFGTNPYDYCHGCGILLFSSGHTGRR